MKKLISFSLLIILLHSGLSVADGQTAFRLFSGPFLQRNLTCRPGDVYYASDTGHEYICGPTNNNWIDFGNGGGTGVTTVSVTPANGVSGSVANPTTTPAITLTLGAITPSSVSTANFYGGGTTSSFPQWKRSSAAWNARLGDDSADAAITAAGATLSGNLALGSSGVVAWNSDAGINRQVANVISASAGGASRDGWFVDAGTSVVSTQFDKTDTALANITGLSAPVQAGRTYTFKAVLFVSLDSTGLGKVAIGGTATATSVRFDGYASRTAGAGTLSLGVVTALGTATTAFSVGTLNTVVIDGTIKVNAGGTLTVQFAQSSTSGTSSVLILSSFTVRDTGSL